MNRGPRRRGRALTALAALLSVAGLLSACASVASSGPVTVGRTLGVTDAGVELFGADPPTGGGAVAFVRQFLQVGADIRRDHEVARGYLTAAAAAKWRAGASVDVVGSWTAVRYTSVESSPRSTSSSTTSGSRAGSGTGAAPATSSTATSPTAKSPTARTPTPYTSLPAVLPSVVGTTTGDRLVDGRRAEVTVTAPLQARVDGQGVYTAMAPGTTLTLRIGLVASGGSWHVTSLPDGIVLTPSDFSTVYVALPVYFPDSQGRRMVPDVRWFPSDADAVVTSLVTAVLAGPSSRLAPAVRSAVPDGTHLTAASVPVVDGVASIDVTSEALSASLDDRRIMLAQLRASLEQATGVGAATVRAVKLTVASREFTVAAKGPVPPVQTTTDVEDVLVGVRHGRVATLTGDTVRSVTGLDALAADPRWPAVSVSGADYAVLDGSSVLKYRAADGYQRTVVTGHGPLTPPSVDPWGWAWTAEERASSGPVVHTGGPEDGRTLATASWPAGSTVRSLRVSPDGTLLVALLDLAAADGGGRRVVVSAIARGTLGRPISLSTPTLILDDEATAEQVTFADATHVAVLERDAKGASTLVVAQVGGLVDRRVVPDDAAIVAVRELPYGLAVTAADGTLWRRSAAGWAVAPALRYAGYAG